MKKNAKCNQPCYFKNRSLMDPDLCSLINIKSEYVKDCPCRTCLISPICTCRCDASYEFIEDYHEKIYEEVGRKNNLSKEEFITHSMYTELFRKTREGKRKKFRREEDEISM